jgi:hypothetical protein
MFFNVSGYILQITNDSIQLRIIDDDDLTKFQKNLNKMYKTINLIDLDKKKYNFKINKQTKIIIKNYNYENLSNLIGIYVTISGYFKYYCFNITSNTLNEINNELEDTKKYKKGYINICNKIYN